MATRKLGRAAVWLAAVALAGLGAMQSFAAALGPGAADAAIATGWAGGQKYAATAALSYVTNVEEPPFGEIERLSREGLRRKTLNPTALALLGLAQEAHGADAGATRLFKVAQRVSRRDVLTHFALVNRFAAKGNLAGALDHYDLALRTNNSAVELMVPILGNAIRDLRIQKGFADLVRQRPPWLLLVLDNMSSTTPFPDELAKSLVLAGGLPPSAPYPEIEQRLLARVLAKDGPAAARAYFLSLAKARVSDLSTLGFDARTTDPKFAPLTWTESEDPNASGAFVRQGATFALEGSAAPNVSGVLASRTMFLPAGNYRVAARSKVEGDRGAALTMTVRCLVDGRDVAIWEGDFAKPLPLLTIASACAAQNVILSLAAGEGPTGAEAELTGLRLQHGG